MDNIIKLRVKSLTDTGMLDISRYSNRRSAVSVSVCHFDFLAHRWKALGRLQFQAQQPGSSRHLTAAFILRQPPNFFLSELMCSLGFERMKKSEFDALHDECSLENEQQHYWAIPASVSLQVG